MTITLDIPTKYDYSHHLSSSGKSLVPSEWFAVGAGLTDVISLGGGNVHPSLFPMKHATFTIPALSSLNGDLSSWKEGTAATSKIEMKKSGRGTDGQPAGLFDLSRVLHYGHGSGFEEFDSAIRELNRVLHSPKYTAYRQFFTLGNLDALSKICQVILEPGVDTVLVDEYCYAGALGQMRTRGLKQHPIRTDEDGMDPEDLERALLEWDTRVLGKKPHVLYIVPAGQNPTGTVLASDRYDRIYAICQKHDILILEDDLYFHLQYTPYEPDASIRATRLAKHRALVPPPPKVASKDDADIVATAFRSTLVASSSFLSRDTDGRVLRLDSVSKSMGPGHRMGWITCNPFFYDKLLRVAENSTQTVNNFSQAILASYLAQDQWGIGGFLRWIWGVRLEYQQKRDYFMDKLLEYGDSRLVTPARSSGGMYMWVKINTQLHPRYRETGSGRLTDELYEYLIVEGRVVVIPAKFFLVEKPGEKDEQKLAAFRVCFSGEFDQLEQGAKAFGTAVTKFFRV